MERRQLELRTMKFEVGEVVVTPAASAAIQTVGHSLDDVLARHCSGDWGDVSEQARDINERGLIEQFNVQSSYLLPTGQRLVVVTNGHRTLTMVHLEAGGFQN